ncbi:MAG TPA: class I adenylate-forming enzyme family protein [Woeseiaceae bacterium]
MTPNDLQPVFRQFQRLAEITPDARAIQSGTVAISYAELASRIAAMAATLATRMGVGPGDRVVMMAESNADFVCAYFATHSIGAICVPLDPHVAAPRLRDIVERVSPRLVISEKPLPSQATVIFDELAAHYNADATANPVPIDIGQTADILFTTGTTGRPKGVILSHRALATACAHINEFIGMRQDAVEVLPLPLSHSFGLGRVRCVLAAGAALVLVPGFVNASRIFEALANYGATGFASVPTGIAILLGDQGKALHRFSQQLQYIEIGSSAMPLEHKRLLMSLLPNTKICMHYGLTEASRSAYLSFHDDEGRLDSIGLPSPRVEMRVVDEAGRVAQDGVDGHIEVRGGHLFTGYWQDPDLTAETLHDGWLRTGDLGRRDGDGYYYLQARFSDIINVGGRKVSPQEIEEILATHPAIAESACVGIPDPQGISGEMVSAFLVAKPACQNLPGFPELAKLLRQKLEPYKIPRKFTWIEEIPKSSSGKILRRQLKDL